MAVSALSIMRRPAKVMLRRDRTARSATRCMRGMDVAKQETSTRPGVRSRTGLEGRDDGFFSRGEPLVLDVGAVGQEGEDTSAAPGGEALHVRAFARGPWRRS